MPRNQVANIGVYDFGTKDNTTEAEVLKFRVKDGQGGKLSMLVEAQDTDITFSVETSTAASCPAADGSWDAVSAAAPQSAITGVVVQAMTSKTAVLYLHGSSTTFFRIKAKGGRANVQIRGDERCDYVKL